MILKRCTNCADDGGRGYDNRGNRSLFELIIEPRGKHRLLKRIVPLGIFLIGRKESQ